MNHRRGDRGGEHARADREHGRGEAGAGLVDAGDAEAGQMKPVDERGFFDAEAAVERRHDPVARAEHGDRAGRVAGLVVIPEGRTAEVRQQHEGGRDGDDQSGGPRERHGGALEPLGESVVARRGAGE